MSTYHFHYSFADASKAARQAARREGRTVAIRQEDSQWYLVWADTGKFVSKFESEFDQFLADSATDDVYADQDAWDEYRRLQIHDGAPGTADEGSPW